MLRSQIAPMPEYFDRYILMADDTDHLSALTAGLRELEQLPAETFRALGRKVYALGKWTIAQILQHLIDTERVFTYRALAFARCESGTVLPFDEDAYAAHSFADERTIEDLTEELIVLRRSTIALFRSFNDESLQRTGAGFRGPYSVLSIAFILAGHPRWHLRTIREKYLPLLGS
ncbi:MAG: DinB family protein [Bacteroidetes bacterium]|nr:DinB family protein [Bacteroidota bacterium]